MEAAVNIRDAGKTHFSLLAFLKKYLYRVKHMYIMVNLPCKHYFLISVKCTNSM